MPHRPPRGLTAPPVVRPHPAALAPLTGLDLARQSGARVVIGQPGCSSCYAWQSRTIILSPEVARGSDLPSLLVAAEEAAHHRQPRWLHALRFLTPLRWLAEADAFLRLKRSLGLRC